MPIRAWHVEAEEQQRQTDFHNLDERFMRLARLLTKRYENAWIGYRAIGWLSLLD